MSGRACLVTCEHAGNRVPRELRDVFQRAGRALASHRGWDPGSLELGRSIARGLRAPLIASTWTRLLVDLNRSRGHPDLFSEWTAGLPAEERRTLIARYWDPHRDAVRAALDALPRGHLVLHLGVHTFTPVRRGVRRRCDVGVLYDPARPRERELALRLREAIRAELGGFVIRRNYPYLGIADGLITSLRRERDPDRYLGIELEVNQRHVRRGGPTWVRTVHRLARACEIAWTGAPATASR